MSFVQDANKEVRTDLVMITNENDALQAIAIVLWLLEQERHKCLNLEDLASFFHHNIVVFKALINLKRHKTV